MGLRKSNLGPAVIASFSSQDFSRSNKQSMTHSRVFQITIRGGGGGKFHPVGDQKFCWRGGGGLSFGGGGGMGIKRWRERSLLGGWIFPCFIFLSHCFRFSSLRNF